MLIHRRLMRIKKRSKRKMELLLLKRPPLRMMFSIPTSNPFGIKRRTTPAGRRPMDEVLEYTRALAQLAK